MRSIDESGRGAHTRPRSRNLIDRKEKVTVVPCGPTVNDSERKAIERLKGNLIGLGGDGVWVLLTNLTLSTTHRLQSDEIDIVVLGPPGVRVIEVKHWTAAWVRRNADRVGQEADKVTNKAKKIGTTLRAKIENLPHVDGVFLITEAPAKVEKLIDIVRGVRFQTLKAWQQAVGVDAPENLTSEQIMTAARLLEPRSAVVLDGELRRLAGYGRLALQTDPAQRFHRVYRGTHVTRQERVVLSLYDLSASDESNAEHKARREFDTLRRLQRYNWAPRIVDSYQDVPDYSGEMAFFTIADPAAPTIKERADDETWDPKARAAFARGAIRAVREFHEATVGDEAMVHRNLTSRTVLVKHDNTPILTGFEYTRISTEVTVASADSNADWDESVPPEIQASGRTAADRRSDVYSLCASLQVLFLRSDNESQEAAQILATGTEPIPSARSDLNKLERELSALLGESLPLPPPPPARFWTEDQVISFGGSKYKIIDRLGSGGVGTTFKVVEIDHDTQEDLGTYVAKVVHEQETGERVLGAYRLVRSHLRHPGLSTVFQVAQRWEDNAFAALMTWIEGDSIAGYAGLVRELAEDMQEASDDALTLHWLRTACTALGALHRNGLVHGDVSPRNLILSGNDVVLTDYDCVAKINESLAAPGTLKYCSPSYQERVPAGPSDDIYALAASLFFVLFNRDPFHYDGVCAKERGLNWDGLPRDQYAELATFLDRATAPDRNQRFASAAEALGVLDAVSGAEGSVASGEKGGAPETDGSEQQERRENKIEWLKSLLQSYPGSLWGNRETRGLDTDFAARTYVETTLEQALYDDVRERRASLVVLCGNAGDGKTAILQRLAKRLGLGDCSSAARILAGKTDDGLDVRMNLDGSAAWEGRSADQLLEEILGPFQHGRPSEDRAHLLAINDGRLLEWIEDAERRHDGATPLTQALTDLLENRDQQDSHVRFVNLNQRSLVGGVASDGASIETGFLDALVDKLYGGEHAAETWAPCQTCAAQDYCTVFQSVRRFAPGDLAADDVRRRARRRLFDALQAVHLRGEVHVTVRELRAALVYVLFGLQYCTDYHAAEQEMPPSYWDRAFDAESPGRQGDVLRELIRFDPALDAHPHIDRALLHPQQQHTGDGHAPRRFDTVQRPAERHAHLASERRRAYFEWTEDDIRSLAEDSDALGLAQGRHLRQFRDLPISDDDERGMLTRRLCGGISRLEGLPLRALESGDGVPLRITPRTPTETAFWVEKPADAFCLSADLPTSGDLDRLHRRAVLIYRYRDEREEPLLLGYELFHVLMEMADGYQLGDVATDDTFAQLAIFVQRLVRENERRMMAWSPMDEDTIYNLSADDADNGGRQLLRIARHERGSPDAE